MEDASARLDTWLHAARFFKTRALAAQAVEGGRVELNGQKTKRAKPVRPGDALRIRSGPVEFQLTVLAVSKRRESAKAAALLYRETPESVAIRQRSAELHRLAAQLGATSPKGRPTKRDRREIERLKNGET